MLELCRSIFRRCWFSFSRSLRDGRLLLSTLLEVWWGAKDRELSENVTRFRKLPDEVREDEEGVRVLIEDGLARTDSSDG